jgi:hypothetical protein
VKDGINGYTVAIAKPSALSKDENSVSLLQESSSVQQARISVSVPRGIYKQLKLLAHDRDVTVSALLLGLIKNEIQGFEITKS